MLSLCDPRHGLSAKDVLSFTCWKVISQLFLLWRIVMTARSNAISLIGLLGLVIAPASAQAGLNGDLVDVSAYYPDTSTLYSDGGVTTVGPSVEYPVGSFPAYQPTASVDLTNDQIIISGSFGQFLSGTFNGFAIKVLSGSVITSDITDASSTLDPLSMTIVGNTLWVNFEGIPTSGTTTGVIDVGTSSTAPEASTWAMMLAGFVSLGFAGYRKARKTPAFAA
jgi:hypothetical protein